MDEIRPVSDLGREDYLPGAGRPDVGPPHRRRGVGGGVAAFGAVFALMIAAGAVAGRARSTSAGADEGVVEAAGYFFSRLILMLSAAGLAFGILEHERRSAGAAADRAGPRRRDAQRAEPADVGGRRCWRGTRTGGRAGERQRHIRSMKRSNGIHSGASGSSAAGEWLPKPTPSPVGSGRPTAVSGVSLCRSASPARLGVCILGS